MPVKLMPDILYLLLPIGGAFLLLFLVCFCGRRVKEVFQYPKELLDPPVNNPAIVRRRARRKSKHDDDNFGPKYTIRIKKRPETEVDLISTDDLTKKERLSLWLNRLFRSKRRRDDYKSDEYRYYRHDRSSTNPGAVNAGGVGEQIVVEMEPLFNNGSKDQPSTSQLNHVIMDPKALNVDHKTLPTVTVHPTYSDPVPSCSGYKHTTSSGLENSQQAAHRDQTVDVTASVSATATFDRSNDSISVNTCLPAENAP